MRRQQTEAAPCSGHRQMVTAPTGTPNPPGQPKIRRGESRGCSHGGSPILGSPPHQVRPQPGAFPEREDEGVSILSGLPRGGSIRLRGPSGGQGQGRSRRRSPLNGPIAPGRAAPRRPRRDAAPAPPPPLRRRWELPSPVCPYLISSVILLFLAAGSPPVRLGARSGFFFPPSPPFPPPPIFFFPLVPCK